MDEDKKAQLRRYNRNIRMSGSVVIVYGVWSVIKFIVPILFGTINVAQMLGADEEEFKEYGWFAIIIIIIMLGIILLVHVLIGRGAINYSTGKKKSRLFFVGALIFFGFTLCSIYQYGDDIKNVRYLEDIDETLAAIMMDLTFLFVLFDLMRSTIKVSGYRKLEDSEK